MHWKHYWPRKTGHITALEKTGYEMFSGQLATPETYYWAS